MCLQLFKRYLGTIVHRHMHVIMPHLRTWLAADNNKDLLLQDLVSSHITLLVAITLVITITASLLMLSGMAFYNCVD
jgi:hypothetical protein